MVDKAKLAKLLRALAEIVESSTDDELDALGRSNISDLIGAEGGSKRSKNHKTRPSDNVPASVDVSGVIESIRDLSSREAGVSLLEGRELTKRSLEQIARQLDLPVLREDTSKRLIQKIVEAILGPRLNSEAIRGDSASR